MHAYTHAYTHARTHARMHAQTPDSQKSHLINELCYFSFGSWSFWAHLSNYNTPTNHKWLSIPSGTVMNIHYETFCNCYFSGKRKVFFLLLFFCGGVRLSIQEANSHQLISSLRKMQQRESAAAPVAAFSLGICVEVRLVTHHPV